MLFKLIGFVAAASLALDFDTPVTRDPAPVCRVFSRLISGAEVGEHLFASLGRGDFAARVKRVTRPATGGPAHAGRSEQLPELLSREAGVLDNLAHREGVDWLLAWNQKDPHAVALDRVPAFANDLEPPLSATHESRSDD
jgi:hypothetical protein